MKIFNSLGSVTKVYLTLKEYDSSSISHLKCFTYLGLLQAHYFAYCDYVASELPFCRVRNRRTQKKTKTARIKIDIAIFKGNELMAIIEIKKGPKTWGMAETRREFRLRRLGVPVFLVDDLDDVKPVIKALDKLQEPPFQFECFK